MRGTEVLVFEVLGRESVKRVVKHVIIAYAIVNSIYSALYIV